MISNIKNSIISNTFLLKLRTEMVFDEDQFANLCEDLVSLASALKDFYCIDKELMLCLYSLPLVTRNIFMVFLTDSELPPIAQQIEDAWIKFDELVTNCLSN